MLQKCFCIYFVYTFLSSGWLSTSWPKMWKTFYIWKLYISTVQLGKKWEQKKPTLVHVKSLSGLISLSVKNNQQSAIGCSRNDNDFLLLVADWADIVKPLLEKHDISLTWGTAFIKVPSMKTLSCTSVQQSLVRSSCLRAISSLHSRKLKALDSIALWSAGGMQWSPYSPDSDSVSIWQPMYHTL